MFDAIATAIDAQAKPRDKDDLRGAGLRNAEALCDVCSFVLAHGDSGVLPETGGRRPHLSVLIRLEDLEGRARSAMLDFGGALIPETLRMLACDAGVVPIVMNGAGQPLDVGRSTRVIPDGLRRAVTARDRGCAHPGCDRPPSWCEIHHILEWEHHGHTELNNLAMLCRVHHRLIHHSGWAVRIRDGLPEFVPPKWIDPEQKPRRNPAARPDHGVPSASVTTGSAAHRGWIAQNRPVHDRFEASPSCTGRRGRGPADTMP
jgi:5-methylcytosine-specific restriction protein A